MDYNFKDKVVLITGGGKGIGRGTALAFAECGAKVVITGYREESIQNTLADLQKITDAIAIKADVTIMEDCKRAVEEAIAKFITGQMNLENDWETFKTQCQTIGLERYLELVQTTYDSSVYAK